MLTLEVPSQNRFNPEDYTLPIPMGGGRNITDNDGVHWLFVKGLTYPYHHMNINGDPLTDDFTINDIPVRKIVLRKKNNISGSNVYNFQNGNDGFRVKITFQRAQNTLIIESEGLPREAIGAVGAYNISREIAGHNYINMA